MQVVLTIIIAVGLLVVVLVEYGGKRLISLLESSNINIGSTPSTEPDADVGKMAVEFAAVRAQIKKTGTQADVDAFDAKYAACIFKETNISTK